MGLAGFKWKSQLLGSTNNGSTVVVPISPSVYDTLLRHEYVVVISTDQPISLEYPPTKVPDASITILFLIVMVKLLDDHSVVTENMYFGISVPAISVPSL